MGWFSGAVRNQIVPPPSLLRSPYRKCQSCAQKRCLSPSTIYLVLETRLRLSSCLLAKRWGSVGRVLALECRKPWVAPPKLNKPDVVVHTCNLSTWEGGAGRRTRNSKSFLSTLGVQDLSGLYEFLSHHIKQST